jgi:hypothetical protein
MKIFNLIVEEFDNYIEEDYPASFDMEEFKSLKSFNKRIKYCEEHLSRISSGSGRIVYKIDDEKALKLAKNKKGVAQNDVEVDYSQDNYINHLFAETYEFHPDFLWLEMEYCKKLNFRRFKELTGVDFRAYSNMILYEKERITSRSSRLKIPQPENYDELIENEFIFDVVDYMASYDIPAGDLTRMSTYGENSDSEVVIIDYGLTQEVYDDYYS